MKNKGWIKFYFSCLADWPLLNRRLIEYQYLWLKIFLIIGLKSYIHCEYNLYRIGLLIVVCNTFKNSGRLDSYFYPNTYATLKLYLVLDLSIKQ